MEEKDQMELVSNFVTFCVDSSAIYHVAVMIFINKNIRLFYFMVALFFMSLLCFLHFSISDGFLPYIFYRNFLGEPFRRP